MTNLVEYFEQRQKAISEQTPEMIDAAIAQIRKIQEEGRKIEDPKERVRFYADWLFKNVEYDDQQVKDFYEARKQDNVKNYDYSHKFNNCRLFLDKKGACQQFAIGLAMLCYDDPEIECHQLIMDKRDMLVNNMVYKHSATYVRLKKDGEVYDEGVVDPVNFNKYEFMCTREEYIDESLKHVDDATFIGMAYYVPGLELKNMFKIMQSFGKGIKFDFEGYENGTVDYMGAYNQNRLQKFIDYEINENKAHTAVTSMKKK